MTTRGGFYRPSASKRELATRTSPPGPATDRFAALGGLEMHFSTWSGFLTLGLGLCRVTLTTQTKPTVLSRRSAGTEGTSQSPPKMTHLQNLSPSQLCPRSVPRVLCWPLQGRYCPDGFRVHGLFCPTAGAQEVTTIYVLEQTGVLS